MGRPVMRSRAYDKREWPGKSTLTMQTAIGDIELTERVYPVIVQEFSRRHGSGGDGRHKGGDGVVREIEFTVDLDVAILSQRRAIAPYGMAGGEPGKVGLNYWLKKPRQSDARIYTKVNLGGSNQCRMMAGDRIQISEYFLGIYC